ncbi:MAG: Hsp70 family protein, partial [Azovibrio sp.]
LSALVLKSLVADAEAVLGQKIEEAVISVPAYFSDSQRKATRIAGELAGLRVERLINEPTAAALAYGLQERSDGGRFLVLDLGGGTFDVSILELFEGVVEVHASAGDNFLGGEDFLEVLFAACCEDLKIDPQQLSEREHSVLRQRLERTKRGLEGREPLEVQIPHGDTALLWSIDEARFATLSEPLIQRMRMPLERAMHDARLQPGDLDEIILVGGASRMPLVARLVSRMFGRLPLRHVNPDHTVALGAAVAAGLKARDARLEEVILTDVCPYTLGTQVSRDDHRGQAKSGFFHPIIHRNSTVPVSREDTLYPIRDDQSVIVIDVFQGESPMVAKNIKLGEIKVPLPKHGTSDEKGVCVRFTYDINGVLQVETKVLATGLKQELILEQNPGVLTLEEIRERLAALSELKIHPRDKQENLAALARAERLYEELLHEREPLQQWINVFRSMLDTQDERVIEKQRSDFCAAMDALEVRW